MRREDDNLSVSALGGRRNKKRPSDAGLQPDLDDFDDGSVRGGPSQLSMMSRPGLQVGHLSEHSGPSK